MDRAEGGVELHERLGQRKKREVEEDDAVPPVIQIEEERATYFETRQGYESLFTCSFHAGELTLPELAYHVGQNGKILASCRGRWQKISFVWKMTNK